MTVKKQTYYVYRYEGKLNGIENAVVLFSYPEKAFGNAKALRAFISTDAALTSVELLNHYVQRWSIEVFFRQCKNTLALEQYQIRSSKGIQRYWLLMSFAHFICCTGTGKCCSCEEGYRSIIKTIQSEKNKYIYEKARFSGSYDEFLKMIG